MRRCLGPEFFGWVCLSDIPDEWQTTSVAVVRFRSCISPLWKEFEWTYGGFQFVGCGNAGFRRQNRPADVGFAVRRRENPPVSPFRKGGWKRADTWVRPPIPRSTGFRQPYRSFWGGVWGGRFCKNALPKLSCPLRPLFIPAYEAGCRTTARALPPAACRFPCGLPER